MKAINNLTIKYLFFIILFSACNPPSIEQQVEKILKLDYEDFKKRKEIAYSLAETVSIYPLELLIPDFRLGGVQGQVDAIKHMMVRYSQIIENDPSRRNMALNCVSFITKPSSPQQKDEMTAMQKKIGFIIHGLSIKNSSLSFQKTLAISAKEIGNTAIVRIINEWFRNKDSNELIYAISFLKDEIIGYLTNDIRSKIVSKSHPVFNESNHEDAIDLLVMFGEDAVNPLIKLIHEEEFGSSEVRESFYYILQKILNKNPEKSYQIISTIDNQLRSYLLEDISYYNAKILLARIGDPVVAKMKKLMKNKNQSIRFSAAEVLVKMLEYFPEAVKNLTSAIDSESTKIIAKNYPFFIKLGQEGTEKLLLKSLDRHLTTMMLNDYLNCGNAVIESGSTSIGEKHGYIITTSPGFHSGPKWGSGN